MKKILISLLVGTVFVSTQAHALSCEVSYKAKKVSKESSIFGDIPDTKYRTGKVKGKGSTLSKCKRNALKQLTSKQWRIIHAVGKAL